MAALFIVPPAGPAPSEAGPDHSKYLAEAFRIASGASAAPVTKQHLVAVIEHGREWTTALMGKGDKQRG